MATKKLVLTIVVDGENIMGDQLCTMHGVLYGSRSVRVVDYSGPVSSAEEVADAIAELFTEAR